MKKEFIEYQGNVSECPNKITDIVGYLLVVFKKYIKENELNYSKLEMNIIIKIINDALGYTFSLVDKNNSLVVLDKEDNGLNMDYLITLLLCSFSKYSFTNEKKISEQYRFSNKEVASILINFLNYVASDNGYDREFDLRDFVTKYQDLYRKEELEEFKKFILKVDQYCLEIMNNGANADELIKKVFLENGIYRISKSGTVYYSREYRAENKISNTTMFGEEAKKILTEVDAIVCAYYKCLYGTGYNYGHGIEKSQITKNKLIYHRIKRMKTRGENKY